MKNTIEKIFFIVLCVTLFTYCSDDEGGGNTAEEIEANVARDQIRIASATEVTGDAPAPTGDGAPTFEILNSSKTAVPEAGLSLNLRIDDNISGLYLQVDGADSYFDIPSSALVADDGDRRMAAAPQKALNRRTTGPGSTEIGEYILPIGLVDEPIEGEFCFFICVYDANGNVSWVEDYCVIVNAWGGSADFVGDWEYTYVKEVFNGETYEDLYETTTDTSDYCDGQSGMFICTGKEDDWMGLESNGDYTDNYNADYTCVPQCDGQNYDDGVYKGKWSYNAYDNTLTVVDYSYEGVSYSEVYDEPGIYFSGKVETINATTLKVREDFDGGYFIVEFRKRNN